MILIKKNGSDDDCFLSVEIRKERVKFSSSNYCSSQFLHEQIENFSSFLREFPSSQPLRSFELKLGAATKQTSYCCPTISLEMQPSGKFLIKVFLSQHVNGFLTENMYDQCTVYFGADIASLDEFMKELSLFNSSVSHSAILETINPYETI